MLFRSKPNFKQNARWYLFAIAVYPVVIGITLLIGKLCGWVDVSKFSFAAYLPILGAAFLPEFFKNIFEESVWRGYLTVKMEQLSKNEWVVYLVVALVWQAWHLSCRATHSAYFNSEQSMRMVSSPSTSQ